MSIINPPDARDVATPRIVRVASATIQANFNWTYVRVYTKEGGLYGTGECFFAPGLPQIIAELGAVLEGEECTATERLIERLRWAASGAGSLGGIVWNAITGIEAALLDLKGKVFGLPVYQLLGGRLNAEVPVYVDCHGGHALEALDNLLQPVTPRWANEPETSPASAQHSTLPDRTSITTAACERALEMREAGYSMMKFDLDIPGTSFDAASGYTLTTADRAWLVDMAMRLRETVGPDVGLAFDAHWRYRASDIVAVAKDLEPMNPLWIEDPVPPHDLAGFRHVRAHTSVPIATGENLQLRSGYAALFREGACDIIQPDLQKVGGLIEAKYIAAWAVYHNLGVAVHMIGGPIAMAASVHFATTVPNLIACEYHASDVPFFHELAMGGTASWFSGGRACTPDSPGLGVELNEGVAERYLLDGSSLFG